MNEDDLPPDVRLELKALRAAAGAYVLAAKAAGLLTRVDVRAVDPAAPDRPGAFAVQTGAGFPATPLASAPAEF